jgi:hypothetical protein
VLPLSPTTPGERGNSIFWKLHFSTRTDKGSSGSWCAGGAEHLGWVLLRLLCISVTLSGIGPTHRRYFGCQRLGGRERQESQLPSDIGQATGSLWALVFSSVKWREWSHIALPPGKERLSPTRPLSCISSPGIIILILMPTLWCRHYHSHFISNRSGSQED